MIKFLYQHLRRGLQFQPTQFVLDISRNSYISRMSGAWPHWDSIPPHIKNAILADVLVSNFLNEC